MRLFFQARRNGGGEYLKTYTSYIHPNSEQLFETFEGRALRWCYKSESRSDVVLEILAVDELHYYTGMFGR